MIKQSKISIIVPIHDMTNGDKFLWRLVNSLMSQTYKNYELIITKDGKMAENTNSGIKKARGEWIKILYLDDYFTHDMVLDNLLIEVKSGKKRRNVDWVICGTNNNLNPFWTDDILSGNNKLGSPSALLFRNDFEDNLLFDENMSWLLDCDYFQRMKDRFGYPLILQGNYITLGEHSGQMTNILTNEQKLKEHELINQKYAK